MKIYSVLIFCCWMMSLQAQDNTSWSSFQWLIGSWKGEGSGQPGNGGGIFSFRYDLGKKIIVRNSHSEYPASGDQPAISHDDLMIITPGNPAKAIYFDNEGHVIHYNITCNDSSIVFVSERTVNAPIFRLTYVLLNSGLIDTRFEISKDGENFSIYIEGKCIQMH